MRAASSDLWLRVFQFLVIGLVFGAGLWQLFQAGFDWRVVLSMTSPWVFFLAMASLPVFGFPISACYLYAGLVFHPLEASLVSLAALSVNMSVSYVLMHTILKVPLSQFLERRNWSLPELKDEHQFRFIFLVRTVPGPPFFFQNLALSLAGIPFWTYLWISLLTQGSIAIGVILCSRYVSQDPFGKGGSAVLAIVIALLLGKSIQAMRKRKKVE